MKTLLGAILVCLAAYGAGAQTAPPPKHAHHNKDTNNAAGAPSQPAPDPAAAQAAQVLTYQKAFVPAEPWRVLNDKTNFAKGADWVQFEGKVTQVTASGLVLQGWFGEPLCYLLPNNGGATTGLFLLSNFPRHVSAGQLLSRNDRLVAFKAGTKDELPNLDYGSVYVPQLTEEQKTKAAEAKSKTDERVLAFHKELADKGDAYGEYKMGVRYLNGDGVDKDPQKAREMLTKAAAQGNKDAADALSKLTATN